MTSEIERILEITKLPIRAASPTFPNAFVSMWTARVRSKTSKPSGIVAPVCCSRELILAKQSQMFSSILEAAEQRAPSLCPLVATWRPVLVDTIGLTDVTDQPFSLTV